MATPIIDSMGIYGSPAFIKLEDLWPAIKDRQLIERSNFCQPSKLSGHHVYSYADPGNVGKAHSEAENIESFDFYEQFNVLTTADVVAKDNHDFLIQTGNLAQTAIEGCGDLSDTFSTILAMFEFPADNEAQLSLALARISVFNFVVGTTWLISAQV